MYSVIFDHFFSVKLPIIGLGWATKNVLWVRPLRIHGLCAQFSTQPYHLEVRGLVLKVRGSGINSEHRFEWFEVRLLKVREVRGSEISGSFQV